MQLMDVDLNKNHEDNAESPLGDSAKTAPSIIPQL